MLVIGCQALLGWREIGLPTSACRLFCWWFFILFFSLLQLTDHHLLLPPSTKSRPPRAAFMCHWVLSKYLDT